MNMWIEHDDVFYNLSRYSCIIKSCVSCITLYINTDYDELQFASSEERDAFFDQIRFKLFPNRFGGIPC